MPNTEKMLTRYLLGEATATEEEQIEEELLADGRACMRLAVVEDDLIDAYVRKNLAERESRWFEQRWLATPERRARVDFALELAAIADRSVSPRARWAAASALWRSIAAWWQLPVLRAMPAFGLLIALVGLSLMKSSNDELKLRLEALESQSSELVEHHPTLALLPITRGDGVGPRQQRLLVSPQHQAIRLEVPVEHSMPKTYEVSLSQVRGAEIETWSGLGVPQSLKIDVPTDLVPGGRYSVKLYALGAEGRSLVDHFEFEIEPGIVQ